MIIKHTCDVECNMICTLYRDVDYWEIFACWNHFLDTCGLDDDEDVWLGVDSLFVLNSLPNANITNIYSPGLTDF